MPRSAPGPSVIRRLPRYDRSVALLVGADERVRADQQQAAAPLVSFEPEYAPPKGSRALILTDQANNPGPAGTISALAGLSRTLERGWAASFRQIVLFVDNPTLVTRATWQVRIDGVPVAGLDALTLLFRATSSLSVSFDTLRVEVPEGKTISVIITNVDGVARVLGAQLVGWTYKPNRAAQG